MFVCWKFSIITKSQKWKSCTFYCWSSLDSPWSSTSKLLPGKVSRKSILNFLYKKNNNNAVLKNTVFFIEKRVNCIYVHLYFSLRWSGLQESLQCVHRHRRGQGRQILRWRSMQMSETSNQMNPVKQYSFINEIYLFITNLMG